MKLQTLLDQARQKPQFDLLNARNKLVNEEMTKHQKSTTPAPNRGVVQGPSRQVRAPSDPYVWNTVQYWKPKPADWHSPHGVRLVQNVDELAYAMDQDRCGILVLLHHESEVQEAMRLLQADPEFPVTVVWLTNLHATEAFRFISEMEQDSRSCWRQDCFQMGTLILFFSRLPLDTGMG